MRINPLKVLVLSIRLAVLFSIWWIVDRIAAFFAPGAWAPEPWQGIWHRGEWRPVPAGGAKPGDADPIPSMGRFRTVWSYFWRGNISGAISGLGQALGLGPLGPIASGLVASAVIGGEAGKVIAAIGGHEAAKIIFMGDGLGGDEAAN